MSMSCQILNSVAKYLSFCASFEPILITFPNSYLVEPGFSLVHDLLSKQRSTLNIECEDLWHKFPNLQPNIRDIPVFIIFPIKNNSRIKGAFAFIVY